MYLGAVEFAAIDNVERRELGGRLTAHLILGVALLMVLVEVDYHAAVGVIREAGVLLEQAFATRP